MIKKGIAFKFFKIFVLIIVIPIILINIAVSKIYTRTLLDKESQRITQTMEQTSLGIANETKRISLTASTLSNDDGIMDMVTMWNRTKDTMEKFDISSQIDYRLNYLFNFTSEIEAVVFFFKDKGHYYYKNDLSDGESKFRQSKWYDMVTQRKGMSTILDTFESYINSMPNKYVLSVAMSPEISNYRNDVEVIYLVFRTNIFEGLNTGIYDKTNGTAIMLDSDNNILYCQDETTLGKNISSFGFSSKLLDPDYNGSYIDTIKDKKMFISSHIVQKTKWKIINLIDYEDLTKEIRKISHYSIIVSAIILSLFCIFSILFFNDIIRPINKLIKKMKNVEKGDFSVGIDITGSDEIYHLGNSFNKMVVEIDKLMIERDAKEREKNRAEIEVLQSQINPHFLSNTLNSIRFMAMMAKVDSIKNMSEALIKLLSASFGKTGKFISVKEELENLENYIFIMKIRYGNKFDFTVDIEEKISDLLVLRLVLQPIIENAILHGISELEERGYIELKGYMLEQSIIFEVKDNGTGMTEEQIYSLLNENKKNTKGFSSIGVKNVEARIKLNHGKQYGLSIESNFGKYTLVKIVLPQIISFEEESSNKEFDS